MARRRDFFLSKKIFLITVFGMGLFFYRLFPLGPDVSGKTLVFLFFLFSFLVLRMNGKYPFYIGLTLLLLCAFFLLTNHPGMALRVSIYSWGFLVIGALLRFADLLRQDKRQ